MSTISFANLKGGVGKTTSSVFFIYWLSNIKKKTVAVVDADEGGNTAAWLEAMKLDVTLYQISNADDIAEQSPVLQEDFEYVIICSELQT